MLILDLSESWLMKKFGYLDILVLLHDLSYDYVTCNFLNSEVEELETSVLVMMFCRIVFAGDSCSSIHFWVGITRS